MEHRKRHNLASIKHGGAATPYLISVSAINLYLNLCLKSGTEETGENLSTSTIRKSNPNGHI